MQPTLVISGVKKKTGSFIGFLLRCVLWVEFASLPSIPLLKFQIPIPQMGHCVELGSLQK